MKYSLTFQWKISHTCAQKLQLRMKEQRNPVAIQNIRMDEKLKSVFVDLLQAMICPATKEKITFTFD